MIDFYVEEKVLLVEQRSMELPETVLAEESFKALKCFLMSEPGKYVLEILKQECELEKFNSTLDAQYLAYMAGKKDMYLVLKKIAEMNYESFCKRQKEQGLSLMMEGVNRYGGE